MRPNLPSNILYSGIYYAYPINLLAQIYIPFQRPVKGEDLEAIAQDFVEFAAQKTGELHDLRRINPYLPSEGYNIIGLVEQSNKREVLIKKYIIHSGFLGVKNQEDLLSTIMITINNLTEFNPRKPITLRQEMGKVLEKYVTSLKNSVDYS